MERTLDLTPRLNGRVTLSLQAAFVRPLQEADIALLETERGIKTPPRKKLRDRHHALARCLAQGMKVWEASAITGYTPSTISILLQDPTFKELMEFYHENEDAQLAEFTKRATMVTITALNNIQELVEDDSVPLTLEQNLTVVKTLADRTGYAPVQKSITANVNVDLPGRLAAAKARLLERLAASKNTSAVLDVEFNEIAASPRREAEPGGEGSEP